MSLPDALTALTSLLGPRLVTSGSDLANHARSESHFPDAAPEAVAYPESTDEVSRIMAACHAHGVPVTGWGAGSSLEAQSQPIHGGLVVDFSRMNRLIEVRPEDMDATLQPGLNREELNTELRATGLFFPVDPGANASLGGMAMTRASGTTTVRYGSMRDNVLALEVVLADGRVIRTGTRARKSSAGYDLTALMLGSEGTLGLVTEMTVRLHPQPEAISAGITSFESLTGAVETVMETIQSGIPMARIEFADAATARAFNNYANAGMEEKPHLMVEFHGAPEQVRADAERFAEIVSDNGGSPFRWSDRPEERRALWDMRHKGYYAILAARPGSRALITDICVPISRLAEAVEETQEDLAKASIPGPILGHVGDGNFHAILLVDPDRPEDLAEAQALSGRMVERALRLGGTSTGEHGVGLGKLAYMQAEHGEAWDVMGSLKAALDPTGILNPGKLVPQADPRMAE